MNKKTVVVVGGGISGLTAAHELIERDYNVRVFEATSTLGGKARSYNVFAESLGFDLPAEHGFRLFPGFYKHITDTMKRIPFGKYNVLKNLINVPALMLARPGRLPAISLTRLPRNFRDIRLFIESLYGNDLEIKQEDILFFSERIWQLATSCYRRRIDDLEKISWWDFIDAENRSIKYQDLLANGLTRTLIASNPRTANARTVGDVLLQLIWEMTSVRGASDRILNGPTNEVWIDPWHKYLTSLKVNFFLNSNLTSINLNKNIIESITVMINNEIKIEKADYYIFAIPVEKMALVLNESFYEFDQSLNFINDLKKDVEWMCGVQFYLNKEVKIISGHINHIGTPWALTSISQNQFWDNKYCKENKKFSSVVKSILSVDVSDWTANGILYNKPANACSYQELKQEIWEQLKITINVEGKNILKDEDIVYFHVANSIKFENDKVVKNSEPLFINKLNSWSIRPNVFSKIKNMLIASDFVKTNTNLATMEAANEAARRAVNCILEYSQSKYEYCRIWQFEEPLFIKLLRYLDKIRYKKGLPWKKESSKIIYLIEKIYVIIYSLFNKREQKRYNPKDFINVAKILESDVSITISNVSLGGVGFFIKKSSLNFEKGNKIKILINELNIECEVRFIHQDSDEEVYCGAAFLNMTESNIENIKKLFY